MCGRYRLAKKLQAIAKYFTVNVDDTEWEPRYNIAPTQSVPVVRQNTSEPNRELSLMRWGLVPRGSNDVSIGARLLNARSETAATKSAFAEALQRRRCLIPADGFYEWQRAGKMKQPFCFEVNEGEIFAFAGLWDSWLAADGKQMETFTILTTTANPMMADVHDRMPVILPRENYDLWLDPGMRNVAAASDLLRPFDARSMKRYAVSARVNSVTNDDAECSQPVELLPPKQAALF